MKSNKGSHKMPDGTIMSGKRHTKDSKPVRQKKTTSIKKVKRFVPKYI